MKKLITILVLILISFTGCSYKTVKEPIYIKQQEPILPQYKTSRKFQFGKLYNKNGNVCIIKWKSCIPKQDFLNLVYYIKDLKSVISDYNTTIDSYNKNAIKNNKGIK